jgi:hypothetical protein
MSEKQEIIKQMMELQRKFIDLEQNGQFSAEEYYDNEGDSELAVYKRSYDELAIKLVDLAHAEKGSHR